jgi:butyrate kinase
MRMFLILALNPGSTSTKIALFQDEACLFKETLEHGHQDLEQFSRMPDQAGYRRCLLLKALQGKGLDLKDLSALVVRGGLLKPLAGGVYRVSEAMAADLEAGRYGSHASNLGALLALPLAEQLKIPIFTVDPVTVDEFAGAARYSGLQGTPRLSMSHALNSRAVARRAAAALGKQYQEVNLVVAHLGSGISVSAHRRGRMVDVNNANNEGPFSLERCGTLPGLALIDLCYSGRFSREEALALVTSRGGIFSYLGTKDFRRVEDRVRAGEAEASRVVEAMVYQIAKEIGAMAAVLEGKVEGVVVTGGLAHSTLVTAPLARQVAFIAPVTILPGEEELEALAAGALRALRGEEEIKEYV